MADGEVTIAPTPGADALEGVKLDRLLWLCSIPGRIRFIDSDGDIDIFGTDGEDEDDMREVTGPSARSFKLGDTSLARAVRGDEPTELASYFRCICGG